MMFIGMFIGIYPIFVIFLPASGGFLRFPFLRFLYRLPLPVALRLRRRGPVVQLPHQGLQLRPQGLEAAPGLRQAQQQLTDLLGHFHTIRCLKEAVGAVEVWLGMAGEYGWRW